MNNYYCRKCLYHAAGPKIENWGKEGTEQFKLAKKQYNAGYYQRNKSKWGILDDVNSALGKVGTLGRAAADYAATIADQTANEANYAYKVNTAATPVGQYLASAAYNLRSLRNGIRETYLSEVISGNASLEGYQRLRNLSTNVATMAKKVSDIVSPITDKIKSILFSR